jgi:hypothetical protein
VVPFPVLSRTNRSYPTHRSTLNPRRLNLLRPLCPCQKTQLLCNQANTRSFGKTPGWGVSSYTPPLESATYRLFSSLLFIIWLTDRSWLRFRLSSFDLRVSSFEFRRYRPFVFTLRLHSPQAISPSCPEGNRGVSTAFLPRAKPSGTPNRAVSPLFVAFAPNRSLTPLSTAFTQSHRGVGYPYTFLLATHHSSLATFRPLCFHHLTNCFSRKSFVLITIRVAQGCGPHFLPFPAATLCGIASLARASGG